MHAPARRGEVLREYLPARATVRERARQLGVSRQALTALLNRRAAISVDMALRPGSALGTSAEMWLQMLASHDLWKARRSRRPRVRRIVA